MTKYSQQMQCPSSTTRFIPVVMMFFIVVIGVFFTGSLAAKAKSEIVTSENITKNQPPEPSFMKEMSQVHYFLWIAKPERIDAVMGSAKTETIMVQLDQAATLDPITINLMMSPNPKLSGQAGIIRYDLTILRPDGSLYDPVFRNLTAFEGVWPKEASFVLNGPDVVAFRFETKDSFGEYTIIMDVTDGVTGQKVRLQTKLKHLKPAKP